MAGIYNSDGSLNIVLSSNGVGAQNTDGYLRCTDATNETSRVGLYAPDGSMNVTILANESTRTGRYAANGSVNVVNGAGSGSTSPTGALNVTLISQITKSLRASAASSADGTSYTFAGQTLGTGLIVIAGTLRAGVAFSISSVTVAGKAATIAVQVDSANTKAFIAYVVNSATTGDVVINCSATVARCGISIYKINGYTQTAPYLTGTATRDTTAGTLSPSLTGSIVPGIVIACAFNGQPPAHRHSSGSVVSVTQTNMTITANVQANDTTWPAGVTEDVDISVETAGTAGAAAAVSAAFK